MKKKYIYDLEMAKESKEENYYVNEVSYDGNKNNNLGKNIEKS